MSPARVAAPDAVTLVIPGRDCSETLRPCLQAVLPLRERGELAEILFVDDASTDGSGALAASLGVRVLRGPGRGAGAARNVGWRSAKTPLVWFIDSDCVAEKDALAHLRPRLEGPGAGEVAAVGGSYVNMRPGSLLACLIHEEIVARHARMPPEVDFLATFNVLYRRRVLLELEGFDERFVNAQDAELAYRVRRAGYRLRFERRSRVAHFHPDRLRPYLGVQRRQGYWRARLYALHPERAPGDSYSGLTDHLQPPLALAILALSPLLLAGPLALAELGLIAGLWGAQIPMTARLLGRSRDPRQAAFAALGFVRAFHRGVGLAHGALAALAAGPATTEGAPGDDLPAYERATRSLREHSRLLGPRLAAQIAATVAPFLPRPLSDCDVIDVGCGYGHTALALAARSRCVLGVEPSAVLAAHARELAAESGRNNLEIRHADLADLPAEPLCDLAVLDNVLEHIPDQRAALRRLAAILRPGGAAFILVPNKLWPIEAHYGLPALSWLPLPLANAYLRATGRGRDYTDASYAPTLGHLRRLFAERPELDWQLVLPADLVLTRAGGSPLYRAGARAIERFPALWAISKALLVIARRRPDGSGPGPEPATRGHGNFGDRSERPHLLDTCQPPGAWQPGRGWPRPARRECAVRCGEL